MLRMFNTDEAFRTLCLYNDWWTVLLSNPPADNSETETERKCKEICYKIQNFDSLWGSPTPDCGKIFAGGLFSCLKVRGNSMFVGMLDGLIKMWRISERETWRRPVRMFEGHEESVTCLDVDSEVLVSGSLDHSVRVWSTQTSCLLRVLRRQGSPILMVRLLSDRLLWWTRAGSLQISSWRGFRRVEPDFKFSLLEDPVFCLMDVGEHYIVTTDTQESPGHSSRDLIVYSSRTGMRLFEKDIFSSHDISCLALQSQLLYIGCGNTVEVWDVKMSRCLALIQSASSHNLNIRVKNIAVSDFLVVVSLSNGNIFYLPAIKIIEQSLLNTPEPAIINWDVSATMIFNTEQTWKNIDFSGSNLVFGLEKRLGDIKIFKWNQELPEKARAPNTNIKLKYEEEPSEAFDDVIDLK